MSINYYVPLPGTAADPNEAASCRAWDAAAPDLEAALRAALDEFESACDDKHYARDQFSELVSQTMDKVKEGIR